MTCDMMMCIVHIFYIMRNINADAESTEYIDTVYTDKTSITFMLMLEVDMVVAHHQTTDTCPHHISQYYVVVLWTKYSWIQLYHKVYIHNTTYKQLV